MAQTFHGKNGKFCRSDSANTVVKDGERYKVVRQHRKIKQRPKSSAEALDHLDRVKGRVAMVSEMITPGRKLLHKVM